jgi:hypothetical protein
MAMLRSEARVAARAGTPVRLRRVSDQTGDVLVARATLREQRHECVMQLPRGPLARIESLTAPRARRKSRRTLAASILVPAAVAVAVAVCGLRFAVCGLRLRTPSSVHDSAPKRAPACRARCSTRADTASDGRASGRRDFRVLVSPADRTDRHTSTSTSTSWSSAGGCQPAGSERSAGTPAVVATCHAAPTAPTHSQVLGVGGPRERQRVASRAVPHRSVRRVNGTNDVVHVSHGVDTNLNRAM